MESHKRIIILTVIFVLVLTTNTMTIFAASYTVTEEGVVIYTASAKRVAACEKMKTMSEFKWFLGSNLTYNPTKETTFKLYAFKDGKSSNGHIQRVGIPYTQIEREHSFPNGFKLNVIGYVNISPNKTEEYTTFEGTDCSSSVAFSWRKGANELNASKFLKRTDTGDMYRTKNMFYDAISQKTTDGSGKFLKPVGSYGKYIRTSAKSTTDVVKGLNGTSNYVAGKDIYSEVYAKVKPGDALLTKGTDYGHVRLVTGVKIVKDASGKVDPKKSTISFNEQRGFGQDPAASTNPANSETSWRQASLSFYYLSTGLGTTPTKRLYIPITLKDIYW